MNYFVAVVLGLIEGITEFLPVSSTFHLIWVAKFLGVEQNDYLKVFEVAIQSGAILAVIGLYFKTLSKNILAWKLIFLSFVPTMLVGFILYKVIKDFFFTNDLLQISVFFLVGVIFIIWEKIWRKKKLTRAGFSLTVKEALLVGLIQSLAVIPGVSRAGAVILSLMYLGVKREEAAKYSFILAVPTILAASAFDLWQNRELLTTQQNYLLPLLVGFLVSFIAAWIFIKWLVNFLAKHTLAVFGYYRVLVSLLLLLYLFTH
ncbi:undecaprenyl-diphosphate phosphatase [Candidatus Microgenomates bacterium]|nr:undecaprenyl-diphosphate phosphatase [Candidatus Microgenomates bacterium]